MYFQTPFHVYRLSCPDPHLVVKRSLYLSCYKSASEKGSDVAEKVQTSPQHVIWLFEHHWVIVFATSRVPLYKLFEFDVI